MSIDFLEVEVNSMNLNIWFLLASHVGKKEMFSENSNKDSNMRRLGELWQLLQVVLSFFTKKQTEIFCKKPKF